MVVDHRCTVDLLQLPVGAQGEELRVELEERAVHLVDDRSFPAESSSDVSRASPCCPRRA